MIRIELDDEPDEPQGQWRWRVAAPSGCSRQPLKDACRELQRIGKPSTALVGLFWPGAEQPFLVCTVGTGADFVVEERK